MIAYIWREKIHEFLHDVQLYCRRALMPRTPTLGTFVAEAASAPIGFERRELVDRWLAGVGRVLVVC